MADDENEKEQEVEETGPGFDEMVDLSHWQTVEDYLHNVDDLIGTDVAQAVSLRRKLRDELLSDPELRKRIQRPDEKLRSWAKEELFGGHVTAVDGTVAISPSQSGGRARIGIVATSYSGDRIKRVLFVSYRQLARPTESAIDYFKRLKKVNRTSSLLMRAVMAFSERQLALQRPERWRLVHGELLPWELWGALGRERPIKPRLELAARLIEARNVIAVVESSHNIELLNAGEALEPGEYIDARDLRQELREFRGGRRDDGRGAHFNQEEGRMFDEFSDRYGPYVRVGVFKAGAKAYIFHGHKDVFEQAAAIVLEDARHQPLRGYPLLVDYADHICSHHLAARDFDRQVQFKTARLGIDVLAAEIDPRKTRRR